MKKWVMYSFIFALLLVMIIGYASYVSTVTVNGDNNLQLNSNDFRVVFTNVSAPGSYTISEDGSSITYTSSSLLAIGNTSKISYRITNYSTQYDADVDIVLTDIDGNELTDNSYTASITTDVQSPIAAATTSSNGVVTITSNTNTSITPTIVIKMNIHAISKTEIETKEVNVGKVWNFNYTGSEQTYTIPYTGSYKLEVWGAQGGNCYMEPNTTTVYPGGYGGYSVGTINLTQGSKLYINVGGQGTWKHAQGSSQAYMRGGYNGGGDGIVAYSSNYYSAGSGGGATHISSTSGLLSSLSNKRDTIYIVAGGGGGAISYYDPNYPTMYKTLDYEAHAGGFKSNSALHTNYGSQYTNHKMATPATQTAGGSSDYTGTFGKGASISSSYNSGCISGGGGGYFGGGSGIWKGSSGGSSYIGNQLLYDKYMSCYNCEQSRDESIYTISNTCVSTDPVVNCAKTGAGYARITYIGN